MPPRIQRVNNALGLKSAAMAVIPGSWWAGETGFYIVIRVASCDKSYMFPNVSSQSPRLQVTGPMQLGAVHRQQPACYNLCYLKAVFYSLSYKY